MIRAFLSLAVVALIGCALAVIGASGVGTLRLVDYAGEIAYATESLTVDDYYARDLYLMDVRRGVSAVVFRGAQGDEGTSAHQWTPTGSGLQFRSLVLGKCVECELDPASGTLSSAPEDRIQFQHSGLLRSPDNQFIVYSTLFSVQLMDVASDETRRIGDQELARLSWSPDGNWLALVSRDDEYATRFRLETFDRRADEWRRLECDCEIRDSVPQWSPDGSRILFFTYRDTSQMLSVTDRDLETVHELADVTIDSDRAYRNPQWSPDGETILLEGTIEDNRRWIGMIALIDADGANFRQLTEGVEPVWSPDGEWIAFRRYEQASGYELYMIRSDGTGLRQLTDLPLDVYQPLWRPQP